MAVPSTINDNVTSGAGSNYNRKTYYENCFMIDDQPMPIPSSWQVDPQILTRDAKRKISNGRLHAPYICTVYTITWTYKYLSSDDYKTLYEAYIKATSTNKNIKHYAASADSNRKDAVFATKIYTEDSFKAPLYRINPDTGEHYYKDVVFKLVSVGGKDEKSNYFTKRTSWKNTNSSFNYENYREKVGTVNASTVVDDPDVVSGS